MEGTNSFKKYTKREFNWTDEEISLLLHIIIDYKGRKMAQGIDWETVKAKYEEITEQFHLHYPKDGSGVSSREYPNIADPTVISKERVVTKIKKIRTMFRKAVDSGRRSGGGRVIFALLKECEEIWSGSPAVHCIENGIQSSFSISSCSEDSLEDESRKDSCYASKIPEGECSQQEDTNQEVRPEPAEKATKVMDDARGNLLSYLKERKDSKLSKRTSGEAQLLDIAREELKLKKATLASIEASKEKHAATMQMFGENLQNLTYVISNGFGMLQRILSQPQSSANMFMQPQPPTYPTHNWGQSYPQTSVSGGNPKRNASRAFQDIVYDSE